MQHNQGGVIWFWMANRHPANHTGPDIWKPYTNSENSIIEKAFQENKDSVGVGDYIVDFGRNIQYRISDHTKTRPIKREKY